MCAEKAVASRPAPAVPDADTLGGRIDPTRATGTAPVAARAIGETEPVAGVYALTDAEYHTDPLRPYGLASLSGTGTRRLLPPYTPAHFHHQATALREPTPSMILGTAVHHVTLGTADLDVFEGASWKSKAAVEFLAEHDPDRGYAPVLAQDVPAVEAMARNLKAHPVGRLILDAEGIVESALIAQHPEYGIWMRGKPDKAAALTGGRLVILDVKTTAGLAYPGEVARTVGKWGYDSQADHYATLARILGLTRKPVTFVHLVVETSAPYLVSACEIARSDMDLAHEVNDAAYRVFARCVESGEWPGYPPTIHPISLPSWDTRAREEAIEATDKESL